jgi:hypothetical protein
MVVLMTRTRSGKTLSELVVIVVVLLGLGGMLAHAVQKVRAAADAPPVKAAEAPRVKVEKRGGVAVNHKTPRHAP